MMSTNLVGVLVPGVAAVSLAIGMVFGIAGTVFHMNKKKEEPRNIKTNKEEKIHQALLASSSLSIRRG